MLKLVGCVPLTHFFPLSSSLGHSFHLTQPRQVNKASVMYDPHTRESRGFGFVTMESTEEADAAIVALNSTELMGKIMTVEKVRSLRPMHANYIRVGKERVVADDYHYHFLEQARRARARTPTPGRYYGPPKRYECTSPLPLLPPPFPSSLPSLLLFTQLTNSPPTPVERPYDPRSYDSRYSRDYDDRRDRRGGGGGGGSGGSRYDDYRRDDYRRDDYRDRDRGDRYRDERRYDDRRY